ncbi:anti-sigma factor [Fulvitalea axinellae]|uniref:Anti-sigma factor n=1 Tax=Fulvitalea axinellae TaxID=1182444 RepID=A0AAU9CV61_9BACT|nr:anti-sigma factor [Fulvitalea axinellae]
MDALEIDELIIRKLSGEATPDELRQLQLWLDQSEDNRKYADDLTLIWKESQNVAPYAEASFDADTAWEKIRPAKAHRRFMKPWVATAVAAGFTLCIGLAILFLGKQRPQPAQLAWVKIETAEGEVLTHMLPDSSEVTLNSNTVLSYPAKFAGKERPVKLASGEAFFSVTKNPDKPFTVLTKLVHVRVLGTRFSVDIRNPKQALVAVEEGRVKVYSAKDKSENPKGLILTADEKGEYEAKTGNFSEEKMLTPNAFSWKTGVMTFNRIPLPEVVNDLEARFNVKIIIENPELRNKTFGGRFQNATLEGVLDSIMATYNCEIEKTPDGYIIK